MTSMKVAIPSAIVLGGFLMCTTASWGKPEYMKKENLKSCTTCHSKMEGKDMMAKNLNETGKCYGANDHSLAKCKVPDKK